ncbi:hypothetical protein [Cupriavidus basilensis]|uniref:hypothetical protein n=1 Tax=Cupriavidus basilensis TaxID=68895 RepID=UPI0039F69A8E
MNRLLLPCEEESHAYWATRELKAWVVVLTVGPEKKPTARQEMFVRARTEERAIACALENNFAVKGRIRAHARLATWRELGCVRVAA